MLIKDVENSRLSWYVYIVECVDGSYYTGTTTDVDKRVSKHNSGTGAKYTRARLPVRLRWFKQVTDRSEALRLEYQLRIKSHKEKEELIRG